MGDISKAVAVAQEHFPYTAGAFYGSPSGLSLGVGMIYDGIRYPLYDTHSRAFDTNEGTVYVLSHECDVDQDNDRHFNDYILICPIIKFDEFVDEFEQQQSEGASFA